MRGIVRTFAAVAGALTLALTLAVPSQAATRTFSDGDKAGQEFDITRVRVTNGTTYVTVTVNAGSVGLGDLFTLWIDTDPKDGGPEYKANIQPDTEWEPLRRVETFASRGTTVPGCWAEGTASDSGDPVVVFRVRRDCMKKPGSVRVAVRARYEDGSRFVYDWAPGHRRFFPSVAQG